MWSRLRRYYLKLHGADLVKNLHLTIELIELEMIVMMWTSCKGKSEAYGRMHHEVSFLTCIKKKRCSEKSSIYVPYRPIRWGDRRTLACYRMARKIVEYNGLLARYMDTNPITEMRRVEIIEVHFTPSRLGKRDTKALTCNKTKRGVSCMRQRYEDMK